MMTSNTDQGRISATGTPRKVLVTGGGGFLGRAVVERLVERGDHVFSFCRNHYPELESLKINQICGDIADKYAVKNAVRGMEIVFHVAAKPGVWGTFEKFYQPNVIGTQNIIDACLKCDVSSLIHTSSPSVVFDGSEMEGVNESVPYPDHYLAHYPKTKAMAEKAVRKVSSKIGTVCLRPHLIWGPRDNHLVPRIIARGKANRLIQVGNGKNKVDVTYIDNAADAHVLAAQGLSDNPELSGRIYFISQAEPVPLWEMVNAILKAGGLPPVKRSISPRAAYFSGACFETIFKLLHIQKEPPMTRFVADELAKTHWFDISAAKKDLGYYPRVSTQEGLKRLENWLSGHKKGSCGNSLS
jgi:2-alkyl-3-oxoalkanoate reductase